MNISGVFNNYQPPKTLKNNRHNIAFQATLPEIRDALEKSDKLCPGKKGFVEQILAFFEAIQEKVQQKAATDKTLTGTFEFKLGEKNNIPENLKSFNVEGATLELLDKRLNESSFSCGPDSDCSCGKGQSLGAFFGKVILGNILKVNKPDVIEIETGK
jgi:hypothetical protein